MSRKNPENLFAVLYFIEMFPTMSREINKFPQGDDRFHLVARRRNESERKENGGWNKTYRD